MFALLYALFFNMFACMRKTWTTKVLNSEVSYQVVLLQEGLEAAAVVGPLVEEFALLSQIAVAWVGWENRS